MADLDRHPAGAFCWIELGTSDRAGAKQFYPALFGWTASDMPAGPGESYTVFRLHGRDAGAAYTLPSERRSGGPHWMPYISTECADDTAAQAARAGGGITTAPLDVSDAGRMAVIRDPAGAPFAVWQAKRNQGAGITGIEGTFCWADLLTNDAPRARRFYEDVFGWEIAPRDNDSSGYLHIRNAGRFIGGIPPAEPRPGVPPHWLLYFLVSDCEAIAEKARSSGGIIRHGPAISEKAGHWAVIADPQGAVFAVFQPLRR